MDFSTTMDALSWEFYNRFFKVLADYGIIYLPLLIFLYQNWLSDKVLGKDAAQNVATLTVKRMMVSVIVFFLLFYLAFIPLVPLSTINNFKFKSADPIPAYDSTFNHNLKKASNQFLSHDIVIKVPIIWGLMNVFSHNIKRGFLEVMPDTAGDIRGSMATAIQNSSIKTPFVKNQYEHFYTNCYSPAAGKLQYLAKKGDIVKDEWFWKIWTSDIDIEEYDWVGGSFYLENAGFYKPCTDGNQCYSSPLIPTGITTQFNESEVSCDWLWNTNGGLRKNLIKEFKLDTDLDNAEANDVMRNYLKLKDNFVDIELDKEAEKGGFIVNSILTFFSWAAEGIVELVTTVIVAFLPIAQSITLLILIVFLPIVLLVSALRIDIFIQLLMFYFTISFLTVVWAIAAYIDNNIMNILTGFGNGNDGVLSLASELTGRLTAVGAMIAVASAILYYQMTKQWFKFMAMVGAEGASEASSAMDNVQEGAGAIKDAPSKVKSTVK